MENTPKTLAQIQATIRAARDSVHVINEQIEKLVAGETPNKNIKGNLERNVEHLKLVVSDTEIVSSGESITDLQAAITAGDAKLASETWPAGEETV
jgi:hypothetical protein